MNVLKVIILGIIEGVTEWLPISSTGHLILFGNLLNLDYSPEFIALFNLLIQLGAILAVIVLFFSKLWPFHLPHTKVSYPGDDKRELSKAARIVRKFAWPDKLVLWLKIIVSCIPALIVGVLLEDFFEEHLHKPVPVALFLIIWGVIFIVVENRHRKPKVKKISGINFKNAFIIGIFEALAILPGTSRSGATITGGLLLGLSRVCAAEYTFYLAIPAMAGGSLIRLAGYEAALTGSEIAALVVGMLVAFIVSLLVIRKLMEFIRRHSFKAFGIYRILLGIVVIIVSCTGIIK